MATARVNRAADIETALRGTGISAARFLESALTAASQVRRQRGADPSREFSPVEQQALTAAGFDLRPVARTAKDPRALSAARFAGLLADAANVGEVAATLGVTPTRIRQRAAARTLYAVRSGDEWRFPRWQFDPQGLEVTGLGQVLAALPPDIHHVAVWRFLMEPAPDLEVSGEPVSPMDWLRAGGSPEPVVDIARDL